MCYGNQMKVQIYFTVHPENRKEWLIAKYGKVNHTHRQEN